MKELEENKEKETYKEIIRKYLLKNKDIYKIKEIKKINISFKRLGGGMNKNYLIKIETEENGEKYEFFFRCFDKLINDAFDRKKEAEIIKSLGEVGYGPKLLDFDYQNERYRIDEYLSNSIELPSEQIFNENILNDLIIILNYYSKISDIYKYEINEEKKSIELFQTGKNHFYIKKNIYDNTINNIYYKSKEKFDKFMNQYNKSSLRNDILNDNNMNKIKNIINNFPNLFSSFFNQKGFFVLNHHDLHQLNILLNKKTNKIFIIDNELCCLSLIGFDIIFYLNMSLFKFFPNYEYYPDLMNYDKFYSIYQKYVEYFMKKNQDWINQNQERFNYIQLLAKEKYFCELLCVVNLFLFIISLLELNFNEENISGNKDIFFINALNVIQLFELSYDKYNIVKNN